ncbi:MAG: M16 family metallopeptidase [Hyphomicrobiales bacterium]
MTRHAVAVAVRSRRQATVVLTAVAAALACLVLATAPARALNVDVSHFTLDNGLQVVVIPDHRAPVVTHMVWYRVGAADEPKGESGIAHFLEHLLFKGTENLEPGEFSRIVRRHGGQDNAFTGSDYTGYYQRISRDNLGLVMEMEADRMVNLEITDEDVATELAVVLEERRSRIDNDPQALLREQMSAALYTAHPYGIPTIGWMSEVSQLTREDAVDFYRTCYTPSNAILVVAGDVNAGEVRELAETHYGPLENTADPGPRLRTAEPEPIAARRVELVDARAASPMLQRIYLAPSYPTAEAGTAEALEVLAQVLGGGSTSRLYRSLVVESGSAAAAGAGYSGDGLDSGSFYVYAVPSADSTIEAVEAEIDAVLADIIADGVTEEELDRARNRLKASTVYALDSQVRLARMFGSALVNGRTVEDVITWTDRIEAVTGEQVRAAAEEVLRLERSVTGTLLPEEPARQAATTDSQN